MEALPQVKMPPPRRCSPPNIATATGCLPAASAASRSGTSAKAATSAVISTGVRRSRDPRTITAWPNFSPSNLHRLDLLREGYVL